MKGKVDAIEASKAEPKQSLPYCGLFSFMDAKPETKK